MKRLKELEEQEDTRKKASMTELEKAQTEAKTAADALRTAQEELYNTRVRSAITTEAVRLNFADIEDAYNLSDLSGIEIGEDGKVTGAKEVLEKLAKAKPYLIKGNGSPGTPKAGGKQPLGKGDEKPAPIGLHF